MNNKSMTRSVATMALGFACVLASHTASSAVIVDYGPSFNNGATYSYASRFPDGEGYIDVYTYTTSTYFQLGTDSLVNGVNWWCKQCGVNAYYAVTFYGSNSSENGTPVVDYGNVIGSYEVDGANLSINQVVYDPFAPLPWPNFIQFDLPTALILQGDIGYFLSVVNIIPMGWGDPAFQWLHSGDLNSGGVSYQRTDSWEVSVPYRMAMQIEGDAQQISAVPLPPAFFLMLSGLGLLGIVRIPKKAV